MTQPAARIDLHTHSTYSDGTDSPAQLMHAAAGVGLDVVALTDHDTTGGWQQAIEAVPAGMKLVRGAEFSCLADDGRGRGANVSVHLLGYLFDPTARAITTEQERLREQRRGRLHRMAERLAADGLPVDPDELLAGIDDDVPAGRPHVARMLVEAGMVSTVDEAFDRYLASGRGYYIPREDTPVERAIEMISDAGGVTVLAHPFAYSRGPTINAEALARLASRGLTGVEVDHPNHDATTRVQLRALAVELDLLPTGSSDYHGANKATPLGEETTDPDVFEALIRQAEGCAVVTGGVRGHVTGQER